MSRLAAAGLLAALLTSGCVANNTRECGTYDFDCEDVPGGPEQVNADWGRSGGTQTASPRVSSADSGHMPSRAELERRIEAMEAELAELRRQVENSSH